MSDRIGEATERAVTGRGLLCAALVERLPLWLCELICDVRLWPFRLICAVRGHVRVGNDCHRCGEVWPW